MPAREFAVILDAGSSGTRAYVYEWISAPNEIPAVVSVGEIKGAKADVGLATLAPKLSPAEYNTIGNIRHATELAVETYFGPLMHAVETFLSQDRPGRLPKAGQLPTGEQLAIDNRKPILHQDMSSMPLYVLATGGMRRLKQENYAAYEILLSAIIKYINSTPYKSPFYDTISGEDEALFGWVAVNEGANLLRAGGVPQGFLEMGGESSQFAVAITPNLAGGYSGQLRRVVVRGRPYYVFVKSWMGLGGQSSWKRHEAKLSEEDRNDINDPCLPREYCLPLRGTGKRIIGTGSFPECFRQCLDLINCQNQECQNGNLCIFQDGNIGCLLRDTISGHPIIRFDQHAFRGASVFRHTTHGIFGNHGNLTDLWNQITIEAVKPFSRLQEEFPKAKESGFTHLLKSFFTSGMAMSTLFLGIGIPMPNPAREQTQILARDRAGRASRPAIDARTRKQEKMNLEKDGLLDFIAAEVPGSGLADQNPLRILQRSAENLGVRPTDANLDDLLLAIEGTLLTPQWKNAASLRVRKFRGLYEEVVAARRATRKADATLALFPNNVPWNGAVADFQTVGGGLTDWTQGRIVLHVNNYEGSVRTKHGWQQV